ncbi:hypothetical protein K2Z83_01005 [Oscillochloris sp. ZM17-4]|uniref:hypothetical protein n=1 Tax=Oscillochloris sp. ZM17-4 TaxID=2866714 RepID=UPI001C72C23F|nr:hypothetical protein [Oscillochloris sp. ZM17-4]MBX0326272.1 hypothetical protein [Oscillochloris sp. ZM17-4]
MLQHSRARRLLMGGFTLAIATLLGLWSWASMASSASLSASPGSPRQNDTVTLVGQGFSPGEAVAVWITYPDFRVYGVAEVVANGDGSFSYPYLPDFLGATFTPTGKYTYTAHGKDSGREVYADISVGIGAAPGTSAGVTLTAEPGKDSQGSYFVFRGSGYWGGEGVAVWLRYPDNSLVDLGRVSAGPAGSIEYILYVTGVPVGHYAFTGRGLSSGANGIAEFDVSVDDLTVATSVATLHIGPSPDTQRSFAAFVGAGFKPSEIVTVWVTLPDYSTRWIGDVQADSAGAFSAVLYLSEQEPVGQRSYTAYGNISGARAVADYTLQPGPGDAQLDTPEPSADGVCTGDGCF